MSVPLTSLVWPLLAQVGLTFLLYVLLAVRKGQIVRKQNFDREKAKLDPDQWPAVVVQVNNNLGNQFESPILFYVIGAIFLSANVVTTAALITAWVFVGFRYAHAFVHTTSNNMKARTTTFALALAALVALFFQLVYALLAGTVAGA